MGSNDATVKRTDPGEKISKGGYGDVSNGLVKERGCTDIICLVIFIAHWVFFVVVARWGFLDGNPQKILYPTDSLGRVCGYSNSETPELTIEGETSNLEGFDHVAVTFNVTEMFGPAVEEIICSGASPSPAFTAALDTAGVCASTTPCYTNWQKACSAKMAGGIIDVQSFVSDPVKEMKNFMEGSHGVSPLNMISRYVFHSCVSNCAAVSNYSSPNATQTSTRNWTLDFEKDILWAEAWSHIVNNATSVDAFSAFKILKAKALPESVCPYPTRYCLYFPGAKLSELAGRCVVSMDSLSDLASAALDSGLAKSVTGVVEDAAAVIGRTYYLFFLVALVIVIVGVIFMVFLRFTVGAFVWAAIIITFLGLIAVGSYALWMARFACQGSTIVSTVEDAAKLGLANFEGRCQGLYKENNKSRRDLYFGLSIVAFIVALLYLLFVLCSVKRIRLAIGLNKVAARFVYRNKAVIFIPVVQIVVAVVWWAVWSMCALYTISNTTTRYERINKDGPYTWCEAYGADAGSECGNIGALVGKCTGSWPPAPVWKDIKLDGCTCNGVDSCDPGALKCYMCGPPRFDIELPDGWHFWYLLFSLLWNNAALVAFGQMTIAGAVGVWYFNQNGASSRSPLRNGFSNCIRYHLGSIAFGSFILAVVQLIKWMLRYLQKQMEAQKQGLIAKIAGALAYCVLCFERCIKFLNKNAYIRIALVGENFCKAAWMAFQLIIRNAGRYAMIGVLGAILSRLGMLLIGAIATVVNYFIFIAIYPDENPWFCVALYLVMGIIGGYIVMGVFSISVDSVLVCFITDEEINDGNAQNTPEELRKFLSKNQAPEGGTAM